MATHFDSDLLFGIDPSVGTVTRVGDLVIIRAQDPVAVWDAVTTSSSTGRRAVPAVADELAQLGVTVEIVGADGLVVRLGAGVDSGRGKIVAGSRKVKLGDRLGSAAIVRSRLPKADPRVAAAGGGALVAAGVVALSVVRRRRRQSPWDRRKAQAVDTASDLVAQVRSRGQDALPVLTAAVVQARTGWENSSGPERIKAARAAAAPHAELAWSRSREFADRVQKDAVPVTRDLAERTRRDVAPVVRDFTVRVQQDVVPTARDLADRARAEVTPRAKELADLVQREVVPRAQVLAAQAAAEVGPRAQDIADRGSAAGRLAAAELGRRGVTVREAAQKRGKHARTARAASAQAAAQSAAAAAAAAAQSAAAAAQSAVSDELS